MITRGAFISLLEPGMRKVWNICGNPMTEVLLHETFPDASKKELTTMLVAYKLNVAVGCEHDEALARAIEGHRYPDVW